MLPFERDGKLFDICLNFQFIALFGKKSMIGESDKWSFAEFYDIYQSLPDDVLLTSDPSNYTLLYYLSNYGIDDFIDKANASCSFNSDEFIEILNILTKLPHSDYNNMMSFDEEIELIHADKLMLVERMLPVIDNYFMLQAQLNDELIIKGYPTPKGDEHAVYVYTNRCAITSQSDVKDGAWEFLKYVFTDDVQSKINKLIPVTVSGLRKQFDILSNQYFLIHPSGSIIGSDIPFTDEERIEYGGVDLEFTDEKFEHFLELLNSIEKVNRTSDNTIRNIVNEEVDKMFQESQTAEVTADSIQNRVSLYLSEQYG